MESQCWGSVFFEGRQSIEDLLLLIANASSRVDGIAASMELLKGEVQIAEEIITSNLNGIMALHTLLRRTQRVSPMVASESQYVTARAAYDTAN